MSIEPIANPDHPLNIQLRLLGWDWNHPRVQDWLAAAERAYPGGLTPSKINSLLKFLFEASIVQSLMQARGLGWDWVDNWLSHNGGSNGKAKLKVWVALRQFLQELELQVLF